MSGPRIPRWPAKRPAQPTQSRRAAIQSRADVIYITARGQLSRLQCERLAEEDDMWAPERNRPWLRLVYAAAIVLSLAASAIQPWGFAQ